MGHANDSNDPGGALDRERAERLAGALDAMADPVRVQVLTSLREGPHKLGDLAAKLGTVESTLSAPVASLVDAGLVGRSPGALAEDAAYSLHDDHVEALLDEAVGHLEHRRLGDDDRVAREI